MVRITFLDGQYIDVTKDTKLIGINNNQRTANEEFYLRQEYNSYHDDGLSLVTTDPRLGIAGFILSHDCFALDEGVNETIYMSSAVKSISVI